MLYITIFGIVSPTDRLAQQYSESHCTVLEQRIFTCIVVRS